MKGKYMTGCVACCIRTNLVLMVEQQNGYWARKWVLPGGKLEMGEELEECAERECFEETGVKVEVVRQVKAYVSYDAHTEWDKQVLLICFEASYLSGFPVAGEGVTGAKWVPLETAIKMNKNDGLVPDIIIRMINDTLAEPL